MLALPNYIISYMLYQDSWLYLYIYTHCYLAKVPSSKICIQIMKFLYCVYYYYIHQPNMGSFFTHIQRPMFVPYRGKFLRTINLIDVTVFTISSKINSSKSYSSSYICSYLSNDSSVAIDP